MDRLKSVGVVVLLTALIVAGFYTPAFAAKQAGQHEPLLQWLVVAKQDSGVRTLASINDKSFVCLQEIPNAGTVLFRSQLNGRHPVVAYGKTKRDVLKYLLLEKCIVAVVPAAYLNKMTKIKARLRVIKTLSHYQSKAQTMVLADGATSDGYR